MGWLFVLWNGKVWRRRREVMLGCKAVCGLVPFGFATFSLDFPSTLLNFEDFPISKHFLRCSRFCF